MRNFKHLCGRQYRRSPPLSENLRYSISDLNLSDIIINALAEQDTYAIGKEKGNELVSGFNEALNELYINFTARLNESLLSEFKEIAASEQLYMANAHSKQYQPQEQSSYAQNDERFVLENHVNTTVNVDGDTIGKVAYKYIKNYQYMTDT